MVVLELLLGGKSPQGCAGGVGGSGDEAVHLLQRRTMGAEFQPPPSRKNGSKMELGMAGCVAGGARGQTHGATSLDLALGQSLAGSSTGFLSFILCQISLSLSHTHRRTSLSLPA